MAGEEQERNHAATPHKLREAKKRGQVAKSVEANFAAVLAAVVMACFAVGPSIVRRELAIMHQAFNGASAADWSSDTVAHWLLQMTTASLMTLAPLIIAVCLCAILANLAQVGPVFSFEPVIPDFTRLNPATGLQRLFSTRMLYEALRSLLKLTILTGVAWMALEHLLPALLKLGYIDPRLHAGVVLGDIGPLLFKLLLAILAIALIDVGYTRWDYAKKMRMSHKELTDEHKQREGDPRIRRRLRELRKELLQQAQAVRKLPEADVLITNPTHVAVALSYRHGEMPAPKLLVKGTGQLAAKMREAARRHNVPVVESPPLARALFKRTRAEEYVPEDLYPQVAKILLWVYAMRKIRQGRTPARSTGAVA